MKRRQFNTLMGTAAAYPSLLLSEAMAASEPMWSFKADIAESCCCDISCPCNFGRPTERRCDGSRLVEITEGQIDGADLSGVSFVRTFEMGRWTKIYADETMSAEKKLAFEKLFPLAFRSHYKLLRSMEWVPLSVTRGKDMLRFEVPASVVEIKLLRGMDGKPIKIFGLPSPVFYDYVQYESVVHKHKSKEAEFSYSGTNGFTSKMVVNSG